MTENVIKTAIMAAALVITAVVVTSKLGGYVTMREQELKYAAVDGCTKVATEVSVYGASTFSQPVMVHYRQCMADKGIEVTESASVSPQPDAESNSEGESVAK